MGEKQVQQREPTLHEALIASGYTAERVYRQNGEFRGMRILNDGKQVHETEIANSEYGWDLVRAALAKAGA